VNSVAYSYDLASYWRNVGVAGSGRVPPRELTTAKAGYKPPATPKGSRVPPPTAAQTKKL
jgi:hypothetical protein